MLNFRQMQQLKTLTVFFILLLGISTAWCQEGGITAKKVHQLSGLILDKDTQEPIPFVKVRVNHSRRGMYSTFEGYFSLPLVEEDTLYFFSIGYFPTKLIIKDYLESYEGDKSSNYLYALIEMKNDPVTLPTVRITPYDTRDKLRAAILNMGTDPNSASALASENLDPEVMKPYYDNMEIDQGERQMVSRQLYYQQYRQQNVIPVAPLVDPISLINYVNQINRKTKKKKDKDLNYWE